ncbi:prostaglandin E synthase 2 [Anopheles darlingi]|uniref:Putative glutathione s-transferase-related protein n=1 Tax=Anopheles darlingi TaxID=43151 RepID=A0A2M4CU14_ANODA|nr:prostaglandin E synthase 2 [Anopheles darlingi]
MSAMRFHSIAGAAARRILVPVPRNPGIRKFATGARQNKTPGTISLALKGVLVGAVVGTGWSGYNFFKGSGPTDHMLHEHVSPVVLEKLPDVKIVRKIVNESDDSGLELFLFQFQTCPFCCKVRAFLDYSGLSYSIVEVDAVLRQDIKWSKSKKVPILLVKSKTGKYIQLSDSSMIVSALYSYLRDRECDIEQLVQYYPSISYENDSGRKVFEIMNRYFLMSKHHTGKTSLNEIQEEERKWRVWADDHLVHLISPNVYCSFNEALETFNWFSDVGEWNIHFPKWERDLMVYVGAIAMWAIAKRLKKRHQLNDDVRSYIYDACDQWITEIEKKKTIFHGGANPNLADLAVFGILNSMEGCQTFKDCLENTRIGPWFYSVKKQILENRGKVI